MFGVRLTQLSKNLDTINCMMKALAIQAKFKTGTVLLDQTLRSTNSTNTTQYNPQRAFANAQSQLSRLNR